MSKNYEQYKPILVKGRVIMDVTTLEQAKIAEGSRCQLGHGPGKNSGGYP